MYSWQRVADPATAAPYADTVLWPVENFDAVFNGEMEPSALGVSAPDDTTFVVKLSAACPYFESLAAFATLSPVNPATVEKNGDGWAVDPKTYVSNGPFMITEWVPGSHILTKANPNYWNKSAIKLDGIKWLLIEDSNASYSAYQTGEALFIKDVPTEEIPSLMNNKEFHIDPILGTYYLNLNCTKEPFGDARVHHVTGGRIRATGLAKKMAREAGIDLALVQPSGGPDGGRIVAKDVENYLKAPKPVAAPAAAAASWKLS